MITDELKQKNLELFLKKMGEIGIDADAVNNVFGDKLLDATFAIDQNSGLAYDGSLLHVVLRTLTPYAIKLNDVLPESLRVEKSSIVKVCLLQHLAKAFMFEHTTEDWKIKKGMFYQYAPSKIAMRLGMRSLVLALKMGVSLTETEIEALTIIDKDSDDSQAKFFSNPISVIIRQANELTTMESVFKQ